MSKLTGERLQDVANKHSTYNSFSGTCYDWDTIAKELSGEFEAENAQLRSVANEALIHITSPRNSSLRYKADLESKLREALE